MTQGMMLRSRIVGVACLMIFASSMALAQSSGSASPEAAAPAEAPPKAKAKHSDRKQEPVDQATKAQNSEAKAKRGRFGSEAEAKAHCKGEIVWVDKDNFNHYAGSREYGRQPGAFACENG